MRTPAQLGEAICGAADDGARIVARGRAAFDADTLLQRAAKNVLAEVGEAAGDLPPDAQQDIDPEQPWKLIVGFRSKIVHDYYELNLDIIWSTLEVDLPSLGASVKDWLVAG